MQMIIYLIVQHASYYQDTQQKLVGGAILYLYRGNFSLKIIQLSGMLFYACPEKGGLIATRDHNDLN